MSDVPPPLTEFVQTSQTHFGVTRIVYRMGEGPPVVVIHEVPGITPQVAAFAQRLAQSGFSVWMPSLFGEPGRPLTPGYAVKQLARACIHREFRVLTRRGSSPVTAWIRALCRHAHHACGGPGVGVVGMCLTGNFALSMVADPIIMAPVLSQPSLPFAITPSRRAAFQMTREAQEAALVRMNRDDVRILGLRFTHDFMCPAARFQHLRDAFGDRFDGIEIDSGPGNPHGISRTAHSVLTTDFVDEAGHPTLEAMNTVLNFMKDQLTG